MELINKVAASGLITINLEEYLPKGEIVSYDIKQNLFMELMLREKDFREFLKTHNWAQYTHKHVAINCTADAIVPSWAYMLLAIELNPFAASVIFGTEADMKLILWQNAVKNIDISHLADQRIVIKGCSDADVPVSAYVALSERLRPIARSIMYGEPCSTVPLYKKAKV